MVSVHRVAHQSAQVPFRPITMVLFRLCQLLPHRALLPSMPPTRRMVLHSAVPPVFHHLSRPPNHPSPRPRRVSCLALVRHTNHTLFTTRATLHSLLVLEDHHLSGPVQNPASPLLEPLVVEPKDCRRLACHTAPAPATAFPMATPQAVPSSAQSPDP